MFHFLVGWSIHTSTCDHPLKTEFPTLQCIVSGDLQVREGVRGGHLQEIILCKDVLDLAVRVNNRQTRNFERNKQVDSLHHSSRFGDGLNICEGSDSDLDDWCDEMIKILEVWHKMKEELK